MMITSHYEYHHHKSGKIITIRPFDLAADLTTLHLWLNYPHTIQNWQLNKDKSTLHAHFSKALAMSHQTLHIVAINGRDLCYAELYQAEQDRLAEFYPVQPGDYGFHLLIGPLEEIGQGHSEALFSALTDYLFNVHQAKRVLVEPNQNTKQFSILERKLGFTQLALINMPEKTAILYAVDPSHFYKIDCDSKEWPLVRMHFPAYPSDHAVINWLNEVNLLLKKSSPCVVVSTFSPGYQFSTKARRIQALWFKRNVHSLKMYCLGMVRVTNDPLMIKKITSNAMRNGMPFICFPATNLLEANRIAGTILKKII